MDAKKTVVVTVGAIVLIVAAYLIGVHAWRARVSATQPPQHIESSSVGTPEAPVKDINDVVAAMRQWSSQIAMPEDPQVVDRTRAALHQTTDLWQEWRGLLNAQAIEVKSWEGTSLAMGTWRSPDRKTKVSLVFDRADGNHVVECQKRAYSLEGQAEHFYSLRYDPHSEELRSCDIDGQDLLWFHPGNKVSTYSHRIGSGEPSSGVWHTIEWDAGGRIIQDYTRNWESPSPLRK